MVLQHGLVCCCSQYRVVLQCVLHSFLHCTAPHPLSSVGVLNLLTNVVGKATLRSTSTRISLEQAASVASSFRRIEDWRELVGELQLHVVNSVT